MENRDYLKSILPDDGGKYYVFAVAGKRGKVKEHIVDTIDEAQGLVDAYGGQDLNVYIATSSLKPEATKREDAMALGKNVLFFDLDVGEDDPKKYPTQKDALLAFKQFMHDSNLPAPTFYVNSGHGIHVYWMLNHTVSPVEWQPVADGIHALAAQHGLMVDPIGKQPARLLRVPGTYNTKVAGERLPCKILAGSDNHYELEDFGKFEPAPETLVFAGAGLTALPANLAGDTGLGTTSTFAARHAAEIANSCPLMADAIETGGASHDNALWFGLLGVLAGCEDGREYAHKISDQHPTYTENDTNYQFQRKLNVLEAGKAGTTTCEYLEANGGGPQCQTCPHWKKRQSGVAMTWTSPTALGVPRNVVNYHSQLPFPYQRNLDGGGHSRIVELVDDGQGGQAMQLLVHGDVDDFNVFQTPDSIYYSFEFRSSPSHPARKIRCSADGAKSPDAVAVTLTKQGVPVQISERRNWVKLMSTWHQQLEQNREVAPANIGMGWVNHGTETGFRIADTTYYPTRDQYTPVGDPVINGKYSTKGTLEAWQNTVYAALRADHIETNALIATSFAAPIVEMLGIDGAMVSAKSQASGTGKTLAIQLGQSVWGEPKYTFALNDTINSIFGRVGQLRHLPVYWDEIRIGNDARARKQFVDTLFTITSGREKARMTQSAELRESGSWQTLVVCTSNFGLSEYIEEEDSGMTAGLNRVLEFEVSRLDESKRCSQAELRPMHTNYGTAGVKYARWLLDNREQCLMDAQATLDALSDKLEATAEQRYALAAVVATYLGAKWAKDAGVIDLNPLGILQFMVATYKSHTADVAEVSRDTGGSAHSAAAQLADYLTEFAPQVAVIRRQVPVGNPDKVGTVDNTNIIQQPPTGRAAIAVMSQCGALTVPASQLHKWLRQQGVGSPKALMESAGWATSGKYNFPHLSTGSQTTRTICYRINKEAATLALFPDDDSSYETSE